MNRIIAFEGHNGVGKSHVVKNFSRKINGEYYYGIEDSLLQDDLKTTFIKDTYWYASALYFFAGSMHRNYTLQETLKNTDVVLDRSFWSTLAVHWDKGADNITQLLSIVQHGQNFFPIPNIIFILTAPYDECKKRIATKQNLEEKLLDELVDEQYFQKEVEFYNWLTHNNTFNSKIITIDTMDKSPTEVVEQCYKYYQEI
ncbi:MAG: hypothetical protein ATN36_04645 [Epulopiscium sp. Nele67-Bin005]|nr:MAG: hypothetical protein ATN36_04645 [Epulopiscium sp. Nele67-Bin005]